jgi:uncharacterized membrane protein (DUF373 family)
MFKRITNFYSGAYAGEVKAWKVFCFGYLLMQFPFAVLFGILRFSPDIFYWFFAIRSIYNVWLIVALWKCSINVSNLFFNILSKIFSVIIFIDLIAGISFLMR